MKTILMHQENRFLKLKIQQRSIFIMGFQPKIKEISSHAMAVSIPKSNLIKIMKGGDCICSYMLAWLPIL